MSLSLSFICYVHLPAAPQAEMEVEEVPEDLTGVHLTLRCNLNSQPLLESSMSVLKVVYASPVRPIRLHVCR